MDNSEKAGPDTAPGEVINAFDVAAYCHKQGWVVVGYDLRLLIRADETARVAILARDTQGHFLAISPVRLNGTVGLGIIDLLTADAQFAPLSVALGRRN